METFSLLSQIFAQGVFFFPGLCNCKSLDAASYRAHINTHNVLSDDEESVEELVDWALFFSAGSLL